MEQATQLRSTCPISFSLDTFGDKWSLLIIRDLVFAGKRTFNEFLRSDEGIARNILASRLVQLEEKGILAKLPHPTDGRKDIYQLSEKGLDLIPIMLDMSAWGGAHEPRTQGSLLHPTDAGSKRQALITRLKNNVRKQQQEYAK